MPAAQFNTQQEVPVSVRFLDDHGRVVAVDGEPAWDVQIEPGSESLVDLDVAPDGMSAVIRSRGVAGHTSVMVTADAQVGDGVREIRGVLEVEVTQSGAVTVEFTVGEPRDITA